MTRIWTHLVYHLCNIGTNFQTNKSNIIFNKIFIYILKSRKSKELKKNIRKLLISVEERDVTGKDYTSMHMNMYTLVGKNTMDVILSLEKY